MTAGAPPPEYGARCSRARHSLNVRIHTVGAGAANMPIRHLGKEVARTDATGMAQVVIEGQVKERVDLQIDTSDPKFAKMHPQNPVASFEITEKDEAELFELKFTADKKPVRKAAARVGPKAL
jgi:hypothetical protein